MKLYRRTPMGFLETHSLETAFDLMTDKSTIYYIDRDDREFLEGLRLMHGMSYILKPSINFTSYDTWEWFTYNPRPHFS